MDWWRDYFDASFAQRYIFDSEATVGEVLMLRDLLPEAPADILDVGCGHGRHSIALALGGYTVTGLDVSQDLLAMARSEATQQGAQLEFVEGDMRTIPYVDCFDGAINMFTSFGYFPDDDANQRVLDGIARALKPGGKLVMELAHRDYVLADYREADWYELDDDTLVWVRRSFDPIRGLNTSVEHWRTPAGEEQERYHQIRLYTATELGKMLRHAGLTPTAWFGSTALHALTPGSPRIVVVAQKPTD